MKINLKNLSDQAIESSTTSTKMRLSEDASSMVFQLFTKNVYSNPIGTVVREITSNCFDSHTEAGITAPVLIKKHKDEQTGTQYISFIDYGVGMSPDRVNNIYGVYFESTKRVDNQQIGGFGIGGKTPLAYKRSMGSGEGEYDNSFYVITVFDKVKYYYCISEGAECPVIHKLHEEPTTENNGTEIQIPVLQKDMDTFKAEMTKQLYYFENIVFEGFEYASTYETNEDGTPKMIYPMDNDYQIIRGKSFLFRGDAYKNSMHVCLGRVAYPIDYTTLGLNSSDYRIPVALRLEVGDVNVTVSRESLDYSEKTIKLLKAKLEDVKAEITGLIAKQYQDIKTLEQYFQVKTDFGKLEFSNGTSLYVGDLVKAQDVDFSGFKYQFMKMPNDKKLFQFFFEAQPYGKKPRKSRYGSSNTEFIGGYETLKSKTNLLYIESEFNRKIVKQAYLKDQFETYYIIRKRNVNSSWMRSEIADLFNVSLDTMETPSGQPVKFVKELLQMQEEYMEIVRQNCEDYDTLEVPVDFIQARKRGSGITPELRKQTIPVKFIGGYSKDRVKLSVLFDYNMPIFYGDTEDNDDLREAKNLYDLLFDSESVVTHCTYNDVLVTGRGKKMKKVMVNGVETQVEIKNSIAFIQVAKGNIKHMAHCKSAYHVSEFKWRMLYRKESNVRQYFLTNEIIEKFDGLSNFYAEGFINKVSEKWGNKIAEIKKYINNIPSEARNSDIRYNKHILERVFELSELKPTPEHVKIGKALDAVIELQNKNRETLNFFNIPYNIENFTAEQAMIMEVSLAL